VVAVRLRHLARAGCLNGGGQIKVKGSQADVQAHLVRLAAIHDGRPAAADDSSSSGGRCGESRETGARSGAPVLEWPEEDEEASALYRAVAGARAPSCTGASGADDPAASRVSVRAAEDDSLGNEGDDGRGTVSQQRDIGADVNAAWFQTRYHKREKTLQTLIMDW
jgi:hypothetical protein